MVYLKPMEDCVFCKIVKGELPSKNEYEDNEILAFHDIDPKAPVHVLIIPKKHVSKLADAEPEDVQVLGKIQIVARDLARKLGIGEAFKVKTLSGEGAGQVVFHMHYHLMG
ncbi:MAG: hypothetical protein UT38_C0030G0007 [Microgenomates group bacterium GW2011_GWA2_39_19]|nr:MAG: hypothetical protein UT38_C0030G0007 [Microgenomates group bacterium GW2011_GWA2_39_19]